MTSTSSSVTSAKSLLFQFYFPALFRGVTHCFLLIRRCTPQWEALPTVQLRLVRFHFPGVFFFLLLQSLKQATCTDLPII